MNLSVTAVPPPSTSTTVQSPNSTLDQCHAELTQQLDAYYDRTKLLAVVQAFVHELTQRFSTSRLVPMNPFASLLAHVRQAEISATDLLASPPRSDLHPPQELVLFDPKEGRNLPMEMQIATFKTQPSPALAVWGMQGVLERLPYSEQWQRGIEDMHGLVAPWLRESQATDEGYDVQSVGVLVGDGVVFAGQEEIVSTVEIERHVVVYGDQLEMAMTVFARHQIRTLFEVSKKGVVTANGTSMILVAPCAVQINSHVDHKTSSSSSSSVWTIESVNANRQAFQTAVKMAVVANGSFTMDILCSVSEEEMPLLRCQLSFFFHFHNGVLSPQQQQTRPLAKANGSSSNRSFVSHSRLQTSGVCFASRLACDIVRRFHDEHSRGELSETSTGPLSVLQSPLEDLVRRVSSTARPSIETRHWLALLPSTTAYRLAWIVSLVDSILHVLRLVDLSDPATATRLLHSPVQRYEASIAQLVQDASIDRSSSLLHGLAHVLKELCRLPDNPLDSINLTELYERLMTCRESIAWLSSASSRDFVSLVQRQQSSTSEPMANLRADIEAAIEQRRYPPAIVAESVFAQFLVETTLDVALERAVVNSVACGLLPNPFITLSGHLRESAALFYFNKGGHHTAPVSAVVNIKIRSVEGVGFAMEVQSPSSSQPQELLVFVSPNERLLRSVDAARVVNMHSTLASRQVYRTAAYHPSKASYSARIFASLVLDDPTLTAVIPVEEILMQSIVVMEHVVVEGKEPTQALWFFADAVRRDVTRLLQLSAEEDAAAEIHLLSPQGDIVTTVELVDMQTFEQLMIEATPKQCMLQVTLPPIVGTVGLLEPLVTVTKKGYAFHHISTEPPATNSNSLSDMYTLKLRTFGVWTDTEAARICVASSGSQPARVGDWDRLTTYTPRALERRDKLLLSHLEYMSPRSQGKEMPLQAPELLLRLLDMETALEWLKQRTLSRAQSVADATPRRDATASASAILMRIADRIEHDVLHLVQAMGYVDAHVLARSVTSIRTLSSSTADEISVLTEQWVRRLWVQVLLVRIATQTDCLT